jgi:hypothetical protein
MAFVIVAICLAGSALASDSLSIKAKDMTKSDSKKWIAYNGPLKLSEQEFFMAAGQPEKAEIVRMRAEIRQRNNLPLFLLAGIGIAACVYGQRNRDRLEQGPLLVGGGAFVSILSVLGILRNERSQNVFPLRIARDALAEWEGRQ